MTTTAQPCIASHSFRNNNPDQKKSGETSTSASIDDLNVNMENLRFMHPLEREYEEKFATYMSIFGQALTVVGVPFMTFSEAVDPLAPAAPRSAFLFAFRIWAVWVVTVVFFGMACFIGFGGYNSFSTDRYAYDPAAYKRTRARTAAMMPNLEPCHSHRLRNWILTVFVAKFVIAMCHSPLLENSTRNLAPGEADPPTPWGNLKLHSVVFHALTQFLMFVIIPEIILFVFLTEGMHFYLQRIKPQVRVSEEGITPARDMLQMVNAVELPEAAETPSVIDPGTVESCISNSQILPPSPELQSAPEGKLALRSLEKEAIEMARASSYDSDSLPSGSVFVNIPPITASASLSASSPHHHHPPTSPPSREPRRGSECSSTREFSEAVEIPLEARNSLDPDPDPGSDSGLKPPDTLLLIPASPIRDLATA